MRLINIVYSLEIFCETFIGWNIDLGVGRLIRYGYKTQLFFFYYILHIGVGMLYLYVPTPSQTHITHTYTSHTHIRFIGIVNNYLSTEYNTG